MESHITVNLKIYAVVVTYNGDRWIEKCLSSLENSTVPLNVIVVDNCSNDSTVSIIQKQFPNVLLIQSQVNAGFGRANNIGIIKAYNAAANYVFLLNQDAWILPNTIDELIRVQKKNPEFFILSPIHLDGTGLNLDFSFSTYITPYQCQDYVSDLVLRNKQLKAVYPINFVNAAFWLISRESISKVGCFDPIFPHYGEDNNYLQRVKYHSGNIGICPSAFAFHDRKQGPVDISKLSHNRRYNRQIVVSLILLMNINRSFYHCFMVFIRARMNSFFAEFFNFRLHASFIELKVTFYALFKLSKIKKRRLANMRTANSPTLSSVNSEPHGLILDEAAHK